MAPRVFELTKGKLGERTDKKSCIEDKTPVAKARHKEGMEAVNDRIEIKKEKGRKRESWIWGVWGGS